MNVRLSVGLIILGILAFVAGAFLFLESYNQKEKEKEKEKNFLMLKKSV